MNLHPNRLLPAANTLFVLLAINQPVVHAQTVNPPFATFQYSSVSGSNNTITVNRVPVTTAAKSVVYKDITIQFDTDPDGNLSISSGFPLFSDSPSVLVYSFRPGRYVGPSTFWGGKGFVTVSGPGVLPGGATAWSLSTASGADGCTTPSTATWYVGPIENSPYAARLKADKITSTAWSYGVANYPNCNGNSRWPTNALIGVSQIGNTLTIASFSINSYDYDSPTDSITFTLVP